MRHRASWAAAVVLAVAGYFVPARRNWERADDHQVGVEIPLPRVPGIVDATDAGGGIDEDGASGAGLAALGRGSSGSAPQEYRAGDGSRFPDGASAKVSAFE